MRTLILGGGLSGLFAAWRLRGQGHEVAVWEAEAGFGGWARSKDWPDPEGRPGRLEMGPLGLQVHRGGALDRLLDSLDLEFLPVPSGAHRWLGLPGGRLHRPDSLSALFRFPGISLRERWAWVAEPFRGAGPEGESLEACFVRRLGPGFATRLLPALVNGLLAAPPSALDRDCLPRLSRMDRYGGLLWGALREGRSHRILLAQGMGRLAAELGRVLGAEPDRRAVALSREGKGWRVSDARGKALCIDQVLLALPPHAAAPLLREPAPGAAALLDQLPSRGLRLVHTRHRPVPELAAGFSLLMDPVAGGTFLGAVGFAPGDPRGIGGRIQVRSCLAGEADPDHALGALRRWVPELGPADQVRVEEAPQAFPVWAPGQAKGRSELQKHLPAGIGWTGAWRHGPGIQDLEAELTRP